MLSIMSTTLQVLTEYVASHMIVPAPRISTIMESFSAYAPYSFIRVVSEDKGVAH